ncbi:N-glycosyltransferase [Caloramator mitchellensis]|uniref:4,4'-diaponeurosporenoate glycosyltransferase n=1 Tax=Caloramator mitchellensis TaxID=908809 RepID=A0A0R3JQS5_CALMK|nr:TIGR04283 family arsenosugar biosynthesis glycosyltransferase [Caloramator mitchellensis]KRQ85798.1 N-glycosyltransferase [Caloramator mitchellensis]
MVSIIIPVLNEEKNIERLCNNLKILEGSKEIVFVDGGSTDSTVKIASRYGKVLISPKGRAIQMNIGAINTLGDILWFVHADSLLNPNSLSEIDKTIKSGYIGGAFKMFFYDYTSPFLKYIEKTSNLRAKILKLYFGDQGIFIRKDIFLESGGFPNIPIMEDLQFSLNIKKYGKFKLVNCNIGTSSRRFINRGVIKTFLLMQKLKLLYFIGVPPEKLQILYRDER